MPELLAVRAADDTPPPPTVIEDAGPDLAPYQGEYRGLVFGQDTEYHVQGLEGILEAIMRTGDRPVPRGHGYIQGPDYAEARTVLMSITVVGQPHSEQLRQDLALVRSTFLPTPDAEHTLRWNLVGTVYQFRGRVVRSKIEYSPKAAREGHYHITAEWRAADPFIYGDAEHTEVVPIFSVEDPGGFDLPTELPIDMAAGTFTRKNLRNEGTQLAYPVVRFQTDSGAMSWVEATNLTHSETLRIETPVPLGDILVANMHSYTRSLPGPHIHIDNVSRFGAWQQPRIPIALHPGDNLVEFNTDATAATCRFTWRDTWL